MLVKKTGSIRIIRVVKVFIKIKITLKLSFFLLQILYNKIVIFVESCVVKILIKKILKIITITGIIIL